MDGRWGARGILISFFCTGLAGAAWRPTLLIMGRNLGISEAALRFRLSHCAPDLCVHVNVWHRPDFACARGSWSRLPCCVADGLCSRTMSELLSSKVSGCIGMFSGLRQLTILLVCFHSPDFVRAPFGNIVFSPMQVCFLDSDM